MQKFIFFFVLFAAFMAVLSSAQKGRSFVNPNRSPAKIVSSGRIPVRKPPPVISQVTIDTDAQSALAPAIRSRPKPAIISPLPKAALAAPVRVASAEGPHPAPEPYSFSFAVNDQETGAQLSREESQDRNGNIVGFYHFFDAEGRRRRVDYTAGPDGFKAKVNSNEEGLLNRNAADADFTVEEVPAERQNAAAAAAQAAARRQLGRH